MQLDQAIISNLTLNQKTHTMSSLVIPPSVFYTHILISCTDRSKTVDWIDLITGYINAMNDLRGYLYDNDLTYGNLWTTTTHELYCLDIYIICLQEMIKGD